MSSEETTLFIRAASGRWPRLQPRRVAERQRLRRALLSRNPITWLASRDGWKQHLAWCLPALALWIWLRFDPSSLGGASAQVSFGAFAVIHALFKVWVGSDASHVFASDRLSGTLELLLSTPLQTREVAAGMLSAFRRRFAGPLAALLILDAALAVKMLSVGDWAAAFATGAGAAMLLADSYCLCWVGLWRGLTARDPVRAIVATLWRVLVLPWIFFAAGVGIFRQSTLAQFAGMWLFLGLLTDAVLWVNARDFFHGHFRTMALRPFGEKPPRVESKWSPMNWEEEPDHQTTVA
jgi:hypothetical protein